MRTMIQAELTATGHLLAQLLAVSTLVSVIVSVATQSVARRSGPGNDPHVLRLLDACLR